MNKALILVDLQNDFCPGGALQVAKGDEVVAVANKLMSENPFDVLVATQDWHPADHGSFASNHPGKKPYETVLLNELSQVLWPDHCVQGSEGAKFHKELHQTWPLVTFQKGTDPTVDSYSGFLDNGSRKDTGLDKFLKSRDVKVVYVMGLALDYCVKFTALDAVRLGYHVVLVLDGCRGVNLTPEDSSIAIAEMVLAGVQMAVSSNLDFQKFK